VTWLWLQGRMHRLVRGWRRLRVTRTPPTRERRQEMDVCHPCAQAQQWLNCRIPLGTPNPFGRFARQRTCDLCFERRSCYQLGDHFLSIFPIINGHLHAIRPPESPSPRGDLRAERSDDPVAEPEPAVACRRVRETAPADPINVEAGVSFSADFSRWAVIPVPSVAGGERGWDFGPFTYENGFVTEAESEAASRTREEAMRLLRERYLTAELWTDDPPRP
jgi:hypothetical protein